MFYTKSELITEGHHAPIISEADFEKVQQMKNERSKSQAQDCDMKGELNYFSVRNGNRLP